MLKTTFKQFQRWKILYLDYYEVSTYNISSNILDLSRYTNLKLLNESMKVKWIKNETVNIRKCLMILQITFLFIVITTTIFGSAVIFTTNMSVHCKSYLLYLHLFAVNLILREQIITSIAQ